MIFRHFPVTCPFLCLPGRHFHLHSHINIMFFASATSITNVGSNHAVALSLLQCHFFENVDFRGTVAQRGERKQRGESFPNGLLYCQWGLGNTSRQIS